MDEIAKKLDSIKVSLSWINIWLFIIAMCSCEIADKVK